MTRMMLDRWTGTNMGRRKEGGLVYFFAHWHATAQTSRQPDDFSHEGLEGEILLQHHAPQDGFQLRNTGTCGRIAKKKIFYLFFLSEDKMRSDGSRTGGRGGALPMA